MKSTDILQLASTFDWHRLEAECEHNLLKCWNAWLDDLW